MDFPNQQINANSVSMGGAGDAKAASENTNLPGWEKATGRGTATPDKKIIYFLFVQEGIKAVIIQRVMSTYQRIHRLDSLHYQHRCISKTVM